MSTSRLRFVHRVPRPPSLLDEAWRVANGIAREILVRTSSIRIHHAGIRIFIVALHVSSSLW